MKRSKRSRIIGLSLVAVVMSAGLLSPTSTLGGFNNGTSSCSTTAAPIFQFTTGPLGGDPFPFDPSGDTRVGASALIGANFLAFSNFPSLISTRTCSTGSGDGCIGGTGMGSERRNLWMRAIPSCDGTLTVRELGYNELNPSCDASNRWIVIHGSGTTNSCSGPTGCSTPRAQAQMSVTNSVSFSVGAGNVYFIEIGLDDCDCFGYGQYAVRFECD